VQRTKVTVINKVFAYPFSVIWKTTVALPTTNQRVTKRITFCSLGLRLSDKVKKVLKDSTIKMLLQPTDR